MSLEFVNYRGERINPVILYAPPAKKPIEVRSRLGYHKGFLVKGIPPGVLERAQEMYAMDVARRSMEGRKAPKEFSTAICKKRAVRSKPYSIMDVALVCADLARKAGWQEVEILAIEKKPLNT